MPRQPASADRLAPVESAPQSCENFLYSFKAGLRPAQRRCGASGPRFAAVRALLTTLEPHPLERSLRESSVVSSYWSRTR